MTGESNTRKGHRLALALLVACTAAFLFEGLFLDQSLLGVDNRLFPPFVTFRSADEPPPGPMNFLTSDINGFVMPETYAQRRRLGAGEVPLWNPDQNLGQPLLADMGYALFYPTVLLEVVFEPLRAYAVSSALHLLLLGFGTWLLFVRRGLGQAAALLGAVTLTFSGFATVHLHLPNFLRVMAWLPWLLMSFDRLVDHPTLRRTGILALQVALCFLAGFPQVSFLVLYLGLAWFGWRLLREGGEWKRSVGAAFLATLLGGGISSVQLLPTAELLGESWRSEGISPEQTRIKHLEPESLVGVLLPDFFGTPVRRGGADVRRIEDFPTYRKWLVEDVQNNYVENTTYVGLVPVMLAALALFALLRRRGRTGDGFHAALLLLALAVVLGVPGVTHVVNRLPGLGAGSPKRVLVLVGFSLAWLAASQLDRWQRNAGAPARGLLGPGVALLVLGLAAFLPFEGWVLPEATSEDQQWFRNTLRGDLWTVSVAGLALIAAAWMAQRIPRTAVGLLVVVAAADLVSFGRAANPPQPLADQYRVTPGIEWLVENGAGEQSRVMTLFTDHLLGGNFGQVFGVRMIGGVSAMLDRESGELLRALDPALLNPDDPRLVGAVQDPQALQSPLLDLLGVRFIVVSQAGHQLLSQPEAAPLGLELVYQSEAEMMAVYQRPSALPPAFFVERLKVIDDREARLAALQAPTFAPADEALVEEVLVGTPSEGLVRGTAIYRRPKPERIEVDLQTDGPAFLVISESHFPGWQASIDGRSCPLYRVDHALMGVAVPPGSTRLELTYTPGSFRAGVWITVISLVISLVFLVDPRRRERHSAR